MALWDDNSTSPAISFSCLVVVIMRETVPSCLRCCCIRLCGSVDDSYDKSPFLEPLNCLNSSRPPPSVQPLKHEAISLLMTCSRGLRQRKAGCNQDLSSHPASQPASQPASHRDGSHRSCTQQSVSACLLPGETGVYLTYIYMRWRPKFLIIGWENVG